MLSPIILIPALLNGLLTGAVYALVALGLTLIYGVLHIINFAHGALLTVAMFAAFFCYSLLGLDPYLAAIGLTPVFFGLGYGLQRFVIGPAAHGEDRNILLVTLGLAVVIENALLYAFRADTRTGIPERAARHRLRCGDRGRARALAADALRRHRQGDPRRR
jgi:branched-chain amino acid transport system permease protein